MDQTIGFLVIGIVMMWCVGIGLATMIGFRDKYLRVSKRAVVWTIRLPFRLVGHVLVTVGTWVRNLGRGRGPLGP